MVRLERQNLSFVNIFLVNIYGLYPRVRPVVSVSGVNVSHGPRQSSGYEAGWPVLGIEVDNKSLH